MSNERMSEVNSVQQGSKGILENLPTLASLIHWLSGLFTMTEEEQEDAGIYFDRPGGE